MKYYLVLIYALLNVTHANAAGNATSDWSKVQLDIASITDKHRNFYQSVRIFKQGKDVYSGYDYEHINGNAVDDLDDVNVVHITGNLNANVNQNDHSELIIGGDVAKNSHIKTSDISRIYIQGNMYGTISADSSAEIIIKGNHDGVIKTGDPHTNVVVFGDFNGLLLPNNKGSLLSIKVHGYTNSKTIKKIYGYEYTEINSAFYSSDIKPGIYQVSKPYGSYYVVSRKQ